MSRKSSTILTALVIAALVAVGVAYLIANTGGPDQDEELGLTTTPTPVLNGGVGRSTPTPPAAAPSAPDLVLEGASAQGKGEVAGVSTSAPTGPTEWVLSAAAAMSILGGLNLVRLQRSA